MSHDCRVLVQCVGLVKHCHSQFSADGLVTLKTSLVLEVQDWTCNIPS